jgi:hypothetical protein
MIGGRLLGRAFLQSFKTVDQVNRLSARGYHETCENLTRIWQPRGDTLGFRPHIAPIFIAPVRLCLLSAARRQNHHRR